MSENPEAEQSFISHLVELRSRLLRAVATVLLVSAALLPFSDNLYQLIAEPLLRFLPEGSGMIAIDVAAPFFTPIKLTLLSGLFLSMPVVIYQLWAFVAPGLYRHEKRLAIPLLISAVLLFYLGVAFAYFVVFPLAFAFFVGTTPEGVAMMTDISRYLDFVLLLFFAFGLAFEVPVATILLVATGMVDVDELAGKRAYVLVGAFVVGMLLTPPDAISQTLLAIPMWLLFEVGIVMARLLIRQHENETNDSRSTD